MYSCYMDAVKDGKRLRVRSIFTDQESLTQSFPNMIPISEEVFRYVAKNHRSALVFVREGADTSDLSIADFEVETEGAALSAAKQRAAIDVTKRYEHAMNRVALFELYNCMLVHDKLASRGIFITPENRDEKYIEIINSEDETLILLLEEYLEMRDRIDPMNTYYKMLREFRSKIEELKTVEEVEKLREETVLFIQ